MTGGGSVVAQRPFLAKLRVSIAKRPHVVVAVSLALGLLLFSHRISVPTPLQAGGGRSAAKTADWQHCGGDADCCRRLLSPTVRPHRVANATLTLPRTSGNIRYRWRMATHPDSDYVSMYVNRFGSWEPQKTLSILNAIRATRRPGVLLDVGANIGWFTLALAHAGHNVVAFEPFKENLAMLRHSLCLAAPEVRARVSLFPLALGEVDGMRCELWQIASHNRGDTFTVCSGSRNAPESARMRKKGFRKLGEAHLRRLDTMIEGGEVAFAEDKRVIMKIDIEGFEPLAFRGAARFLKRYKPDVIFSEYIPRMITAAAQSVGVSEKESKNRPKEFLKFMGEAGYNNVLQKTSVNKDWGATYDVLFTRK